MEENTLEKEISDSLSRRVEILNNSSDTLRGAVLTINGIFLSFFTIISDRNSLSSFETISFAILTSVPIISILLIFWLQKILHVKMYESTALFGKTIIENDIKYANEYSKKDSNLKTFVKIASILNKFLEPLSIFSTIIAIVCIFYFLVAYD